MSSLLCESSLSGWEENIDDIFNYFDLFNVVEMFSDADSLDVMITSMETYFTGWKPKVDGMEDGMGESSLLRADSGAGLFSDLGSLDILARDMETYFTKEETERDSGRVEKKEDDIVVEVPEHLIFDDSQIDMSGQETHLELSVEQSVTDSVEESKTEMLLKSVKVLEADTFEEKSNHDFREESNPDGFSDSKVELLGESNLRIFVVNSLGEIFIQEPNPKNSQMCLELEQCCDKATQTETHEHPWKNEQSLISDDERSAVSPKQFYEKAIQTNVNVQAIDANVDSTRFKSNGGEIEKIKTNANVKKSEPVKLQRQVKS